MHLIACKKLEGRPRLKNSFILLSFSPSLEIGHPIVTDSVQKHTVYSDCRHVQKTPNDKLFPKN